MDRTVLVIDDEQPIRDAFCDLLEANGIRTRVAADAHQAKHLLRESAFDAIVTDVLMPGNGQSVVASAQTLQPDTPIILVSSQPLEHIRELVPEEGVFALVEKMAATSELLAAVRQAFESTSNGAGR